MKFFVKNIMMIGCLLIINDATIAQQQTGTADISITALTLKAVTRSQKVAAKSNSENSSNRPVITREVATDTLKCSITLSNIGNVTAFGKLIVVLPPMVSVLYASLPPNCKVMNERGVSGWPGYVEFEQLLVGANQSETFEFTFSKSASENNISAFVFSTVPDANSVNNYKTAVY